MSHVQSTVFHANGKLLLTAEYFVLDGALALALPTRLGQSLQVSQGSKPGMLQWLSLDERGEQWFEANYGLEAFDVLASNDKALALRLQQILAEARRQNPSFLTGNASAYQTTTRLDFPRNWGLGTSSTLLYLMAQWAQVNPYRLLSRTFGGSGYDIACAGAQQPVLYQLANGSPHSEPCNFEPPFSHCLYFIYLGKKQNSREGIARYQQFASGNRQAAIAEVSALTQAFLMETTLPGFEKLIREHEHLVGETIGLLRAKSLFFSNFWGEIKSLGAWGGDFVLATSDRSAAETRRYFNQKGFDVFLPYDSLLKAEGLHLEL
jgi:mevalonate kinase